MEFRDIRVYAIDDVRSKYEDNPSFYSTRYEASINATYNMIQFFKAKKDFMVDKILLENTSFNLELNNLQAYTKSAGYNTDVEKYSTYDYRCNKKLNGSFCINEGDRVDYTYSYC